MNDTLVTLSYLYYEVHSRFYKTDPVVYFNAMAEVSIIAYSIGYSLNDLAKVVTYS